MLNYFNEFQQQQKRVEIVWCTYLFTSISRRNIITAMHFNNNGQFKANCITFIYFLKKSNKTVESLALQNAFCHHIEYCCKNVKLITLFYLSFDSMCRISEIKILFWTRESEHMHFNWIGSSQFLFIENIFEETHWNWTRIKNAE